jgi:hypothetical protein
MHTPDEFQAVELAAAKEFIIDSSSEGWEEEVNEEKVGKHKRTLLLMNIKELLQFCEENINTIWEDHDLAKALLDVIDEKVSLPLSEE